MKQPCNFNGCLLPMWYRQLKRALPIVVMGNCMLSIPVSALGLEHEATFVQQQRKISGKVIDASGNPVSGAVVTVKGIRTMTTTDDSGRFNIAAATGQTLRIQLLGYETVEVKAVEAVTITLKEYENAFNEAVVIGYGTVRKADLAGSVSVMNDKQFKDQPIRDISEALQGRISGVNVVQSGIPGGATKIRIRGTGSINRSNDPLYVVDGIVRESGLEGLNTEDIQSIQILKDASSTAIYGSRGANGVVLITTKTGKAGQTQVTLDANWGFSGTYGLPEVMDTKTYAQALIDGKGYSQTELQTYLDGTNAGIDWLDLILRTGVTQNYKLVITKGNEVSQFYISGNYMDNRGVVIGTQYQRYQGKTNIHSKLFDWLDVTADLQYSHGKGQGNNFGMGQTNPLWVAFNYSPTMEMYDALGNFNHDPYNSIQDNPYGVLIANKAERRSDIVNGRLDLRFNILPGLTFTTTNGIDYYDYKSYIFATTRVQTQNGMGNSDHQRIMLQSTNNLTYTQQWGKHALTATGVYEASQSTTRTMGISGRNLQAESVGWWDVNNALNRSATNGYSKWSLLSGVARVMYNYDDKYLLTGTFRADGSSRFSKDKWGYFPSIAAAWTLTREDFMKSVKWLSNMKVRMSYGLVGNQNIPVYATLGMMSSTSFNFGTDTEYTGYWASGVATPDLTWEKTKQFDLGFDFGLFNNRVELSFDYFVKKTTDALLRRTLPKYLGATQYWINAGEVSNKGLDVALTARIIQSDELNWTSTINASFIKNEVTKLTAEEPIIYGSNPAQGTVEAATIIKEGEAIGTLYGYRWAGLNAAGLDSYYAKDGTITTSPNSDDRVVLGCANPDFTMGWNNTVSYKNWEFNIFFNSAFGAQRLNLVRFAMNSMVGASKFVTDATYLSEIGKTMPALNAVGNNNLGNSSKWVENADYVRCENISIAYTLPKKTTRFADIRLSLSVQNLFTITGYKGIDPAGISFSNNSVDVDNGIDMGAYPNPRTFTLGVRFNF